MPDNERSREWASRPEGGKDEQKRRPVDIVEESDTGDGRSYAPQVGVGGPDEVYRSEDGSELSKSERAARDLLRAARQQEPEVTPPEDDIPDERDPNASREEAEAETAKALGLEPDASEAEADKQSEEQDAPKDTSKPRITPNK